MSGCGIRVARNISAGAVAAIAAWSSYSHMVHVTLAYGEPPHVAYALPFSVDGMLIVASVVMVDDKRRTHRVRPIARLAFTAGVVASIAANIAAAHPSIGARIVDAWPAVALLLVVEMLARPPASADEQVPPVAATGSQPPANASQPPHPQVPAHSQVPAELPPHTQAAAEHPPSSHGHPAPRRLEAEVHLPAQAPIAARPPDIDQVHPVARHVAATDRRLPTLTTTGTLPSATSPQLTGNGPQAARVVRPHETAEVPLRSELPLVAEVPPFATAGAVPLEDEPPQRRPSAPATRRNPAAATQGDGRRTPARRPAGSVRRPAAATRHLALQLIDAEPDLTRTQIAARLGVSTRRLREVLAIGA